MTWTRTIARIALPLMFLALLPGAKKHKAPVRATLEDGQVLYGDVKTPKLSLQSHLGDLKIPLEDIGEVVPVEGEQMADADGYVKIWLRDGSELVGRWENPELAMAIRVGKDDVRIDLPVDQLNRLQTQGGEAWPGGVVFRVRTAHGDDFLVDAGKSRFTLENDLGEFSPFLTDCVSVRPVDDPEGEWRVELATGTVLIGHVKGNALTLAMPMGPDEVTVPLASFVSMEAQTWAYATRTEGRRFLRPQGGSAKRGVAGPRSSATYSDWEEGALDDRVDAAPAAALEVAEEEDGLFQRHGLERAKQAAN